MRYINNQERLRYSDLEAQVEQSVSNRFLRQFRNRDVDQESYSDSTVDNDFSYVDSETNAAVPSPYSSPREYKSDYSPYDDSFSSGSYDTKTYAKFPYRPKLNSEEDLEIGAVKHNYFKKPQESYVFSQNQVVAPNQGDQAVGEEVTHFTLNSYANGGKGTQSNGDVLGGLSAFKQRPLRAKHGHGPTIQFHDPKEASSHEYELHKAIVRINPKTKELSLLVPQTTSTKDSAKPTYKVKNTIPYPSYFDDMMKEFDNSLENVQQASSDSAQTESPYFEALDNGHENDIGHTFQAHYQYHSAPTPTYNSAPTPTYHSAPTLTRQTDIHHGNTEYTPITEQQEESYAPQYAAQHQTQSHHQNQFRTVENHFQYHPVPTQQHATNNNAGNPNEESENYSYASGYPLNQYKPQPNAIQYQPIPVLQSTTTTIDQGKQAAHSDSYSQRAPAPVKQYIVQDHYQQHQVNHVNHVNQANQVNQVKQTPVVSSYTYQVHEPVQPHIPVTPAPYATPHDINHMQHINYNSNIQHPATGSTKKQIGNVIVRVDPKTKDVFLDLPNWHPIINHFDHGDLKSNNILLNSQLGANGQTQSAGPNNGQLFTPNVEPQAHGGLGSHTYFGANGSINPNDLKIKQSYFLPPHPSEAFLNPSVSNDKFKLANATHDSSKKYAFHSFYEILQNAAKKLKKGLFGGNKR